MTTDTEDMKKLADLAKGTHVGMLTTVGPDGEFISRPMAQQEVEFDGDLWFIAEKSSRKAKHIAANPHVSVTLSSMTTWISINGTAEIVDDRAKIRDLWNPAVEAWFPNGADDPNIAAIKVTGDSAEYWDTPGGIVATVVSFVKSKIAGKRPDVGENETVDLS